MKKIQVYGPGCAKCDEMAQKVKEVLSELNIPVPVEKVTDMMQFAVAGVIVTPALVIDGKVRISGKVPSRDELRQLFKEGEATTTAAPSPSEPATGCNCEGKCGEKKISSESTLRKIIVWVVLLLILLAGVKLINRQKKADQSIQSTQQEERAPLLSNRVELVYYLYGSRCVTCIKMEKWIEEAIQQNYASTLATGQLVWQSKPADKETVSHYQLTSKSLLAKTFINNKEAQWENLNRIWELNQDEQAFKSYVTDEVQRLLK